MHPRLVNFFKDMHQKFDGGIMFEELMELSGKAIGDMPSIPAHCTNGKNNLCFNWIGGHSPFPDCRQKKGHIPKSEVTDVKKMLLGERGTRPGRKRH